MAIRLRSLVLIAWSSVLPSLGQVPPDPGLILFYEKLPTVVATGLPPASQFVPVIEKEIAEGDESDIAKAWPFIIRNLSAQDARARKIAGMAVVLVGGRNDGANFFVQSQNDLLRSLNDKDAGVRNQVAYAYSFLHPMPDSIIVALKSYLQMTGAVAGAGPGVVAALIRAEPGSSEIGQTVSAFLLRTDMSEESLLSTLRAASDPASGEPISLAIRQLLRSFRSEQVRLASVSAISMIGLPAVTLCEPELTEIATNPSERGDLKSAAASALALRKAR